MGPGVTAMVAAIHHVTVIFVRMAVGNLRGFIGGNRYVHMPSPSNCAYAKHERCQPVNSV